VKEVDDTPVDESESVWDFQAMFDAIRIQMARMSQRITGLEKELALVHEQRVTVRPPEADDDPEWF